ncbi:hypothetical protein FSARC_1707 [Fusarium sarcochroum]|uniref:HTH OST-type domain-containing protein n=1 Tax=Fusarium sarcochroum TaxID=1208366 RepID=A0A8H4XES5_9HYPO|nr:hypothetical protein FSARC_1707 [Fusarium sarcochroum]
MASVAPTVKLAVLIDADNAQPSMVSFVLAEIAKYGTAFVKRAYGDWTGPNLKGWKERLLLNSIQPIQQFAYTQGKNATDAAMVIDAMDLLYSNRFDGFCLVSSDSDFTRLASRIRESGLVVYGCGERKTPQPFVTACDKFIYIENLVPQIETPKPPSIFSSDMFPTTTAEADRRVDSRVVDWLREAVDALSDDDGWAGLAGVGYLLIRRHPDFDPLSSSEVEAITAVLHAYGAALKSRNVEETVGLYTDDGVILPPHFKPSAGKQALLETYTRIFNSIQLTIKFDIDEVVVMSPEWAFARTTAEGTKTMLQTNASEPHANQELFIMKKEGGSWKIARYAFSTMKPLVQDGIRRS